MNDYEREVWLEERRGGLGGSDVATLVAASVPGVKSYGTPVSVWASKVGLDRSIDEQFSEPFWWGHKMEPLIAERYMMDTGFLVVKPDSPTGIIWDKDVSYFFGTPDGLVVGGDPERGVEYKTNGLWGSREWGPKLTDEVPLSYLVQCHWYMARTGRPVWDLAACLFGNDYRRYVIYEDKELQEMLDDIAHNFWKRYVITQDPPPVVTVDDLSALIKALYRNQENIELIPCTDEDEKLAIRYEGLKQKIGTLKAEQDHVKMQLQARIGSGLGIKTPHGPVTWKQSKPTEQTDWKAAAIEGGVDKKIIDKHTKRKPGNRTFNSSLKIEWESGENDN